MTVWREIKILSNDENTFCNVDFLKENPIQILSQFKAEKKWKQITQIYIGSFSPLRLSPVVG